MSREELEAELRSLERQLRDCNNGLQNAESEQKDLISAIEKIHKKTTEVENGLQDTMRNIDQRLSNVNPRSKFRARYREQAQKLLFSSNSSSALDELRASERQANNKCLEYDDIIADYRSKISRLKNRIEEIKRTLSQMGEES